MIDVMALTVYQISLLRKQLNVEMRRRRGEFLNKVSKLGTITQEEAAVHAGQGRSSFSLPLGDWALVELEMERQSKELAAEGIVGFWPLITPEEKTPEYLELFEDVTA